jgi:hypothetical protein
MSKGSKPKLSETRLRIAFDVSDEYRRHLKAVSAIEGKSLGHTILLALADKYPALREVTQAEIKGEL